jgi:prevent-host-death family protein
MLEIGVRELKARASEIVRAVRDRRARYLVTYRGKPVGVLLPLGEAERSELVPEETRESAWKELLALGQKIGEGWQSDMTGVEILSEMRR